MSSSSSRASKRGAGALQAAPRGERPAASSTPRAARSAGVTLGQALAGLATFEGVKRRMERTATVADIAIYDDFAHHPTAVNETLKALRSAYDKQRLVAVFEPRTHASMRKVFQNDYAHAFDAADLICIRAPSAIAKIPPPVLGYYKRLRAANKKPFVAVVQRGIRWGRVCAARRRRRVRVPSLRWRGARFPDLEHARALPRAGLRGRMGQGAGFLRVFYVLPYPRSRFCRCRILRRLFGLKPFSGGRHLFLLLSQGTPHR